MGFAFLTVIQCLFIPCRNVVDQSRYDSKGDALKTTTNPAYALVGVSPGTDSPVSNKTADALYEIPSLQTLSTTALPMSLPTNGIVSAAREGEEKGVSDNIQDQ